jgi:hypothetical protein
MHNVFPFHYFIGVYGSKSSYFSDKWNWLDCLIVVLSILSNVSSSTNVRILRTFRILRPLKSLRTVPGIAEITDVSMYMYVQMYVYVHAYLVSEYCSTSYVGAFEIYAENARWLHDHPIHDILLCGIWLATVQRSIHTHTVSSHTVSCKALVERYGFFDDFCGRI